MMLYKMLRKGLNIGFLSALAFAGTSALLLDAGISNAIAGEHVEASVNIEVNATDGDAGIQLFFDAEEVWKNVKVYSPDKLKIFQSMNFSGVRDLGSTEMFTESGEPLFFDMPLEKFLSKFPEGDYKFVAKNSEGGGKSRALATLTHVIPAAPEIIVPDVDEVLNPFDSLVIMWNPVTEDYFGSSGIEITGYKVVVEREDLEPLTAFSVDLPSTATSVTVPAEFLEPVAAYKVEVLAQETSGNKTISERSFETSE